MKKILFLSFALLVCSGLLKAQDVPYYGTPFYKQGFDSTTIAKVGWTQTNDTTGGAAVVTWGPDDLNVNFKFSKADPTSLTSAFAKVPNSRIGRTTLISPIINMTGKSNICLGFSLYNNSLPSNMTLACAITKDGGTTWDTIWNLFKPTASDQQSRYLLGFNNKSWTTYQIFLPSSYDGQTIQAKFIAIVPSQSTITNLYLDGFTLSERKDYDAKLISYKVKNMTIDPLIGVINATGTAIPYADGFMKEPITFTFKNNGTKPIDSITVSYLLQGNTPVSQKFMLANTLTTGNSLTLTFDTLLDLSTTG